MRLDYWIHDRRGVVRSEDSPYPFRPVEGTIRNARTVLCLLDVRAVRLIIHIMPANHLSLTERNNYRRLEDVVGCKLVQVVRGRRRRLAARRVASRTARALHPRHRDQDSERAPAQTRGYGLASRVDYSAAILHVEYRLTSTGAKLASVIEQLHALHAKHSALQTGEPAVTPPRTRP